MLFLLPSFSLKESTLLSFVILCVYTLTVRGTQGIELSSTSLVKRIGTENDQNYNKMPPRLSLINAVIILVRKGDKQDTMCRPGLTA